LGEIAELTSEREQVLIIFPFYEWGGTVDRCRMKTLFPKFGLCLFLVVAAVAKAGVPALNVTVSDPSGKAAFKGATKDDGGFATAKLQPGSYVVQFTTKNSSVRGGQYSIVVAAGTKKVVANAVAGEKFMAGGVAMKVEVGAGLNISGQVVAGPTANSSSADRERLRRMQDRAQDSHQEGFRTSTSQMPDKMIRP
jgi:hypothetical protein